MDNPIGTLPDDHDIVWDALPGSQRLFLGCPIFECLLSGSRGGGKTDVLLMDFLQHVNKGYGAEWQGILFRTQYRDLGDVVKKSLKWFPEIIGGAKFNWADYEWRFPEGEVLKFRHIKRSSDYQAYHGHSYPWIAFEELTNWPDDTVYKLMMSCCRSTVVGMPRKFRATTNPYGVGTNWIKARFQLPMMAWQVIKEPASPPRTTILSYLKENLHLLRAEPDYIDRIKEAARNASELKAWLYGSWDITAGGMFDDLWDEQVHVVDPFPIPPNWRIDRSFDWGSSRPFSVGWWAESNGETVKLPNGKTLHTLPGDLFRVAEWYGWRKGRPNEGLRLTDPEVAKGIKEREKLLFPNRRVQPGPADTQIYDDSRGESTAEQHKKQGIRWLQANKGPNSRVNGAQMVRTLLKNAAKTPREDKGLFIFSHCHQFRRTVPTLPRSDKNIDDVDSEAEDHIYDETRYRCFKKKSVIETRQLRGR